MASRVGDSIDFVVTGHTHKPRAMTYPSGCHYYNAGTWIRSLRLTREVLANSDSFEKRLWPVLNAGRMSAIDAATESRGLAATMSVSCSIARPPWYRR